MPWFMQKGNKHQVGIYKGHSNITENFVRRGYSPTRFTISIPYFSLRVGYSENAYELNSKQYWKIASAEKSKGTYFGY